MQDDDVQAQIAQNRALVSRAVAMVAAPLSAATLLSLISMLFIGVFGLVLALVFVSAMSGAWYLYTQGAHRALNTSGAVPADESVHARLFSLVDGLCSSTGIARPSLFVVECPAANAFAVAKDPRQPSLVVTSGLLQKLAPVELEGLLAQQLCHIRANDTVPAALAVVFPPLRAQLSEVREWQADRGAIAITRYPPGLIGALDKVLADLDEAPVPSPSFAHLWVGPPVVSSASLEVRIDALREL